MKTIDVRVLVPDGTDPEVLVARLAGFEGEPPVTILGVVELLNVQCDRDAATRPSDQVRHGAHAGVGAARWSGHFLPDLAV